MHRHRRDRPDIRALELIGLAAVLDQDELHQLARHTDVFGVPAGTTLARAGVSPRQFVVVLDGYVETADSETGVLVGGPGSRIGGDELLDGALHDATIRTRTACQLVVIFGPALTSVIAMVSRRGNRPEIAARLRADSAPAGRPQSPLLAG
jgi:CRP-like cAMP-binding protein